MNKFIIALMALVLILGCAGHLAAVEFTFDDLSSQQIYNEDTSFVSEELMPFEITNNTGIEWTDFHLALDGMNDLGANYPFMRFTDLGADGIIYSGPGAASFFDVNEDSQGYNEVLTIDGLSIPAGDTLTFQVDITGGQAPEGLASFAIYGMPSIGEPGGPGEPPVIPEPATLLLLGTGLFGLIGIGRLFRKK